MELEAISQLIRQRRSVFPNMFNNQPISETIINEMLENANWAPTHRITQPWRFRVFTGKALKRLSNYLGDYYKDHTAAGEFSEKKYEKTIEKPLQSACVIAICMQRDLKETLPEWEEVAAVACAVQNMWLTAAACGIGAYWSTPAAMVVGPAMLNLKKGESCLGLFYMGYYEDPGLRSKRNPIAEKVEWYSE